MKIFTLLHKSTDKGAINQGQWSRIIPTKPLFNHYCVFTVVIMLLLGGFSSRAWGLVAESGSLKSSRTWTGAGSHVTFTLSGDNGNGTADCVGVKANQDIYVNWDVEDGYTITVTAIRMKVGHSRIVHGGWTCEIYVNDQYKWGVGTSADFKETADGYNLHNDDNFKLSFSTNADLYWVNITYTIKANAPSVSPTTTSVYVTPPGAATNTTLDVASYFSSSAHMSRTYSLTSNPTSAGNLTGSTFYATKAGTYQVKAQFNSGDCHEASALSSALTITVNRLTPTLTLDDDAETEVDLTIDEESPNYFDLTSVASTYAGDGRSYSIVSSDISSYGHIDGNNFYATKKGDYTIRISSPQGDHYTGTFSDDATYREVTITVRGKATPSFEKNYSQATADALQVGDTIKSAFIFTNVSNDEDFTFATTAANMAVIKSGSDVITYDATNNWIVARNKGTATLQFSQEETSAYESASSSVFTFTVAKKSNTLRCAWNNGSAGDDWDENMNFDSKLPVKFSSTNTSGPAISVTQSPASAVATFKNGAGGANPDTIITNFREGTVTWTVSQAEDYKYIGDEVTCSVNVGTDPNCGCNIYTYAGTDNSTTVDNLDCNWTEVGVADSLFFQLKKRGAGRRCQLDVGYKDNGTTKYVGFKEYRAEDDDYYHEFKDDVHDNAIKLQFRQYYTSDPYIKDIRVTRKRWFKIKNAAGDAEITELTMPTRTLAGDSTVATFKVDYSTCASTIKVASNNPHIVVKASDRSFSSTTHGVRTITLKYSSTEAEEIDDAIITIYTPYEHKTLTVNAETKGKLSTTIEYKGADSYAVDHANMNATDLFQVRDENGDLLASPAITLSSSATGVINTVSSNTAIDFRCGGAATITASYAGDATYAAASNLGQTITVNKLSDAISWSSVGDDGKIHVLADTDIPTSIASANSDIASYSVASANPYLSVTEEEGVYTLHAGIVGEVALTATSAGDCTYATASGSKTIAVDPREHAIIWDQNLEGIQTDDRGYITNRRITLNACAVDNGSNPTSVPVSYEITGGGTFATIENGNELVINVANLSGTLSTTITATTTVGTKYAIVSETKTISVVRWGTNTAKSADNTSDIVDGKIVISAPHATFTFSGATAITEFGYATVMGKPEGYKLAQSLDKNGGSMTYNFSWVSTNANCSIQVNKISFWIKAYDSDAFVANKAKVSFDGAKEVSVGTAAMTANDGDFKPFSKAENYTNRNVPVVCWVTGSENFDFYIKNIAIEYTVYTTAPSATGDIEQVDRTINAESDKKTVDVRDLFSYAVAPPSDFEYAYEIVGAPEHAFFLADGYTFWADAVGDYTVRAKVTMDEDHRESDWSDEKTIRVNRVPYVFNNSAADKNWETTTNWRIGGWPIENLPTADDDVIVRGQLSVSEEIPVRSLTIDGGVGGVVEIAPTGGLTIGVGGVRNATRDNFKLKTATTGVNKGQTGYLRVSPECPEDVPMPEVTIEMLRQGYSSGYSESSFGASGYMTWQYIGCPIDYDGVKIKSVVGGWMNSWDETTGTWVNDKSTALFRPFKGFANSQNVSADGALTNYKGRLMPNATRTVALTYTDASDLAGWNLLSNSFAAPIDIVAMFNDNSLDDVEAAVYLFNTGNTSNVDGDAGTYTPITKALAGTTTLGVLYQGVIPSMQGFFVKAKRACDFTFNYEHAVWNATYEDESENTSMRAPKRSVVNNPHAVVVSLEANGQRDKVIIIESEDYSTAFENGYDAHIMPVGNFNIFTVEGEKDYLAIDATNSIIGTRVGVRTGTETAYTMTFTKVISEDDIELLDTETDEVIDINEGTQYTFFAEPNSVITERFQIVARQSAPSITTGVEKAENDTKVHKFIKDDQLYILKNGILYNALGAIVR